MEHYKVPGVSITVINEFNIEWAKGYGVHEAGGDEPVTPDTLFQAASISKALTAVATLHFVEKRLLDLDENVNDKLVSWKVPENEFTTQEKVTLRRLLSNTAGTTVSGFKGYTYNEEIPTLQQILDGESPANNLPIRVDIVPGTKWRYSGGGFMIVQQLLEDIVVKSFPDIMQDTVLEPTGMMASTFKQPLSDDRRAVSATAHNFNGGPLRGKWHIYPEMATAGLWTTASDLARFGIEIMLSYRGESNKILSEEMVEAMLSPQVEGFMGLGFPIKGEGLDLSFKHDGGNEGFKSFMLVYPERGRGIVVMTNGDAGDSLYNEILMSVGLEYGTRARNL